MTKALAVNGLAGLATAVAFLLTNGASPAFATASSRPDQVQQGKAIYRHHCAVCHGPLGEGLDENWKERNAQGELPPPPHDAAGHTWRHSDEMLYRMIREGWRDPFNKTDRLAMPAFRQVLDPNEIEAVVAYLKTLWTEDQRVYQRRQTKKE